MDTNTVQVINQFGDKLDQYLGALANKAGVAADHFYPIFVRQQMIEGLTGILILAVVAVAAVFFLKVGLLGAKSADAGDKWDAGWLDTSRTIIGFVVGGACVLAVFISLVSTNSPFSNSIGKILNPEYYAVQSLVNMVK